MNPRQLIRARPSGVVVLCTASLALALAACSGTSPSASSSSPAGVSPTPSLATTARCAKTSDASPVATVQWNPVVQGSPTIKSGQAVAFVTQHSEGPTVTEGTNGTPAPNACIDEVLAARIPLVVTFYKTGVYHIFCRKAPSTMTTVVTVT